MKTDPTPPSRATPFRAVVILLLVAVALVVALPLSRAGTSPGAASAPRSATPDQASPRSAKAAAAPASPSPAPTQQAIPFPQEFVGSWRPVLSPQYQAALEASYSKNRKPGMPNYEKWAKGLGQMEGARWTFRDGLLTASQGKETQQTSFRVKAPTEAGVLLELEHSPFGSLEVELARVEGEAIELRFPHVTAPPLRLQRVSG